MQDVVKAIEDRTQEFRNRPLFTFMRDSSIDPASRLAFAPFLAHYVMSFADLCRLVLREEPAKDPYQEIVNAHTAEEADHWKWYLADLEKLGCDPTVRYSDALRFLWSDALAKSRLLTYQFCRLALGADSLHKMVLIQVIEATGGVAVRHVGMVGRELSAKTGAKLTFFGGPHVVAEEDHSILDPDTRRRLQDITLEPAVEAKLLDLVDRGFAYYSAFIDEMYTAARSGRQLPEPRP